MALWPDEFEGLRDEARQMAQTILQMYAAGATEPMPTDRDGRVAYQRKMLAAMETTSAAGTDEEIAGVPCRVFRPAGTPRGTYLHLHGGAMILGSPRMNDDANAGLCERLRVTVVSVDYRLAPEFPFPAGGDDCLAVAKHLLDTGQGPIVI